MNHRRKSVHRGGEPVPDGRDLFFRAGPSGLALYCVSDDVTGEMIARNPYDLAEWQ